MYVKINIKTRQFDSKMSILKTMQEKTKHLSEIAKTISLSISNTKTEVMTLNIINSTPIKVYDKDLPTIDRFTYLGSIVRSDGVACDDIKNRIAKARNTFILLNNVWKSSQYSKGTKLKLYQVVYYQHFCMVLSAGE